ncbi:hypothetical protein Pryu01_02164 [Paraliobacillus ryukyuensis]|uniref:Lipoprotein n=1 Tax=Paraliobacillus ryukyuensis TaxID=200904 RepID=A0A366E433_9BACI|nr:hypothetical protein [Paraliobacillus ryukyuensis]RBO97103.1 hypothetical protein DES48_10719 [Paraliobacillus ryukyuensis]
MGKISINSLTSATIAMLSVMVLVACQSESEPIRNSSEDEKVVENPEKQAEADDHTASDGSNAGDSVTENVITLSDGNYTVGEDLSAGRYEITAEQTGNIFVENNSNSGSVSEIIEDQGLNLGVPSVTINLTEGATIEISDLDPAIFTPVTERNLSNTLSTGMWVVGTDIEPGNYEVIPSGERSGKVVIYDQQESLPVYDELIDPDGERGSETLSVELEEGQILRVKTIPAVILQQQ